MAGHNTVLLQNNATLNLWLYLRELRFLSVSYNNVLKINCVKNKIDSIEDARVILFFNLPSFFPRG
jgi:hypothetical protein